MSTFLGSGRACVGAVFGRPGSSNQSKHRDRGRLNDFPVQLGSYTGHQNRVKLLYNNQQPVNDWSVIRGGGFRIRGAQQLLLMPTLPCYTMRADRQNCWWMMVVTPGAHCQFFGVWRHFANARCHYVNARHHHANFRRDYINARGHYINARRRYAKFKRHHAVPDVTTLISDVTTSMPDVTMPMLAGLARLQATKVAFSKFWTICILRVAAQQFPLCLRQFVPQKA